MRSKIIISTILVLSTWLPAWAAQDTVRIFLGDNDAGESAQEAPAATMDRDYNSCYVWADNRDGNWNVYGRLWESKPSSRIRGSASDGIPSSSRGGAAMAMSRNWIMWTKAR